MQGSRVWRTSKCLAESWLEINCRTSLNNLRCHMGGSRVWRTSKRLAESGLEISVYFFTYQ